MIDLSHPHYQTIYLMVEEIDQSWNAAMIGQVFANLLLKHADLGFRDLEGMLRRQESNTYLVAKPTVLYPEGLTNIDCRTRQPSLYGLWICLHGYPEFRQTLDAFGIPGEQDNLNNLDRCGFTVIARPVKPN